MEQKLEKSRHATDLRGLSLIHDNAGAHTYVQTGSGFPENGNCGKAPQSALFTRIESM